jgi:hypothetical protein
LYCIDDPSNLLCTVQNENAKSKTAQHSVPRLLQWSGAASRCFDLHKRAPPAGQKHEAVGHSVKTGADKFRGYSASRLDCRSELALDCFFSHINLNFL